MPNCKNCIYNQDGYCEYFDDEAVGLQGENLVCTAYKHIIWKSGCCNAPVIETKDGYYVKCVKCNQEALSLRNLKPYKERLKNNK